MDFFSKVGNLGNTLRSLGLAVLCFVSTFAHETTVNLTAMQIRTLFLLGASLASLSLQAETQSEGIQDTTKMSEVVVTGTRNATDARYLPLTVTSISNEKLNENYRTSVLPTVMEQTPGLFTTSRGVLGYGVSTGAAGSLRCVASAVEHSF